MDANRVVQVDGLSVRFNTPGRVVQAVNDVSFHVDRGETLAIVGESGSGKSVTSLALMRLVEYGGGRLSATDMRLRRRGGDVLDLARADERTLQRVRGADVAMIFQEPMTSLNPSFTAGNQIAEALQLHQGLDAAGARAEALRMLERVRIPEARAILDRYPHQLSGGMRQRVMIAMALSCKPQLLIADEPTTALDVTIQAQILQLIRQLQEEMDMGVIFITHDMGVVAEVADRVLVMYRGDKVEEGGCDGVFAAPRHAYTRALLSAVPRLGAMQGTDQPAPFPLLQVDRQALAPAPQAGAAEVDTVRRDGGPVLKVRGLVTRFDIAGGIFGRVDKRVHAVEQVSFDLFPGETLALVGESGCGKTTTGRSLLQLVRSQGGSIEFDGRDIGVLRGAAMQSLRRHIQFIFQDPFASLNPRMTVGDSIMEPLLVHRTASGRAARERVRWLMDKCGLLPEMTDRYPHEFSGGQRQRICIARALALNPKVVIADESVSALDVSIQAQIVNLLLDLQRELGVSYLFISHDMAVVERVSHRVAVMYLGQIVEIGPRRAIFENPQHPYTRKLMAAVPIADPRRRHRERSLLVDEIPSPVRKVGDEPVVAPLVRVGEGHYVARHPVGVYA
ncbi:glutathione ABC transporter, ATP-binding protein GsiA [Bordetella bronchiseptica GA96-01]|uniref:dipeptide ABC transporter ATP-binding protein n=1 Tax=Bordetella bronchiseptica TaxID=518 RepID=UPI00045AAE05|nr:dipeptide ABC transporter ATP-binding protein [Bordetella bronchiseptica]AZW31228.1 ABC transporter ATP-binding protein [Bordetella bronchiseptica]KCV39573.1 glutathione ABC transporter, ATP-binding protein GsiA [Bordetella bronchiseptica 345]KDC39783.1 glutathione ABC transporter, ATP-binding protein GsiA [Bordetella bronchiseptica GA96-01]KDD39385.1 glutathione ABC transporter, ATP-binding protein GsiA [Bordetella bronchiseptica MBORD901]KDD98314.1 glutathione ABC transporter, ATP-binding